MELIKKTETYKDFTLAEFMKLRSKRNTVDADGFVIEEIRWENESVKQNTVFVSYVKHYHDE